MKLHNIPAITWGMFLALQERPQPVQFNLIQLELNRCLHSAPSVRLNKISSMVPDEPDLLRHVTQLDVRDNRLTDLDASVFPRLEVLHCERNRIASLKAKGCLLKGIYASNNGGFLARRTSCSLRCVVKKYRSPSLSHDHHLWFLHWNHWCESESVAYLTSHFFPLYNLVSPTSLCMPSFFTSVLQSHCTSPSSLSNLSSPPLPPKRSPPFPIYLLL